MLLPSPESVEEFARERQVLVSQREDLARRRRDIERRERGNRRDMKAAGGVGAIVEESDLHAARKQRDDAWEKVRDSGRAVGKRDAARVDQGIRASDELADRLRREADRVAAVTALRADADLLVEDLAAHESEVKAVEKREREWSMRWRRVWRPMSVQSISNDPESTGAMRDWLRRARDLIAVDERLQQVEGDLETKHAQLSGVRAQLTEALASLGVKVARRDGLERVVVKATQVYQHWLATGERREQIARRLAESETERRREERALAEQQSLLARWESEWRKAMAMLGIAGEIGVEEAVAVLDGLIALSTKNNEARVQRARVRGIEAELDAFQREVQDLASVHRGGLDAMEPLDAAEALIRKYRQTVTLVDTRERVRHEVSEKEQLLCQLQVEQESVTCEFTSLFEMAGVGDVCALEEAELRSQQATALDASVAEIEGELIGAGEGASIADLVGPDVALGNRCGPRSAGRARGRDRDARR